jgi:hypothetical protein
MIPEEEVDEDETVSIPALAWLAGGCQYERSRQKEEKPCWMTKISVEVRQRKHVPQDELPF